MPLGIVRCDMVAESILAAYAATGGFNFPVVLRLQGTNCEKASQLESIHLRLSLAITNSTSRFKRPALRIYCWRPISKKLLKRLWSLQVIEDDYWAPGI